MNIETMDLIERALDATLFELRKLNSRTRRRRKTGAQVASSFADECVEVSEQVSSLLLTIADPLKNSLMQQLHRIGRVLFDEVGTTDRMREIAEWVASLDVENYEFRIDALDNAFLGVGAGTDVWRH